MMAQIKMEWIWLALTAGLMIALPWWLLTGEQDNISEPQPLLITKVQTQEIPTVDILLKKPIFNSERTPLALLDEMTAEEPEAQIAALVTPVPKLVGLVSKRRGKAVAIVKTNDGETKALSTGQTSDGWRLVTVGKNEATFANANEQRTIGLDYGNKAIGGPSGTPVPTADTQENPGQSEDIISDGEPN